MSHGTAVEKSVSAEKAHVNRLERERAAESEKRQLSSVKCLETSQAVSCQSRENEEPVQEPQSKISVATVKMN